MIKIVWFRSYLLGPAHDRFGLVLVVAYGLGVDPALVISVSRVAAKCLAVRALSVEMDLSCRERPCDLLNCLGEVLLLLLRLLMLLLLLLLLEHLSGGRHLSPSVRSNRGLHGPLFVEGLA